MARVAEHLFLVRAGREKSVAATKTYTGQLMILYLLAYALGAKIRIADLEAIPDLAASALTLETEVGAMAERYRFMHHAAVVGRGLNYASAFEFALKLMETSYIVAERFSSADFLHGPIAMVEPNFPFFLFTPSGPTWGLDAGNADAAARFEGGDGGDYGPAEFGGGESCVTGDFDSGPYCGDLFADSVHYPGAVVRLRLLRFRRTRPGPAASFEQDYADVVKRASGTHSLTVGAR